MKNFIGIVVLIIAFALFSTSASAADNAIGFSIEALRTVPEWKKFLDQAAGSTPLETIQKTADPLYHTSEADLEVTLQGKTLLKFEKPMIQGGKAYNEYDIFEIGESRRFEIYDQIDSRQFGTKPEDSLKEEDRFKIIMEACHELLAQQKAGELVMLFMGQTHAIDLYFSFFLRDRDKIKRDPVLAQRDKVIYLNEFYGPDTVLGHPDYYRLFEVVDGIKSPTSKISDMGLQLLSLFRSRLFYYNNLLQKSIRLEQLRPKKMEQLSTLVLMDLHTLHSDKALQLLPSAESLRKSGIKSITLGMEGWVKGKTYPLEDFKYLYLSPHNPRLRKYQQDFLRKKNRALEKEYADGKLVRDLRLQTLHTKLKAYAQAGITVSIRGIDAIEVFPNKVIHEEDENASSPTP